MAKMFPKQKFPMVSYYYVLNNRTPPNKRTPCKKWNKKIVHPPNNRTPCKLKKSQIWPTYLTESVFIILP